MPAAEPYESLVSIDSRYIDLAADDLCSGAEVHSATSNLREPFRWSTASERGISALTSVNLFPGKDIRIRACKPWMTQLGTVSDLSGVSGSFYRLLTDGYR